MKEFGMLSNKMLRKVASHMPRAATMETEQLAMLCLLLHTDDMDYACSIKDYEF